MSSASPRYRPIALALAAVLLLNAALPLIGHACMRLRGHDMMTASGHAIPAPPPETLSAWAGAAQVAATTPCCLTACFESQGFFATEDPCCDLMAAEAEAEVATLSRTDAPPSPLAGDRLRVSLEPDTAAPLQAKGQAVCAPNRSLHLLNAVFLR